MPGVLGLPAELLEHISCHIKQLKDVNNFGQVNWQLYNIINPILYSRDAKDCGRWAVFWAATSGQLATLRKALDAGSPLNAIFCRDTPLMLAASLGHTELVHFLLLRGAAPEWTNGMRSNAMHLASMSGHAAVVKLLIDVGGVDVNIQDARRTTSLGYATRFGHLPIVELLLDCEGLDINRGSERPLRLAASKGHEEIFNLILDRSTDEEVVSAHPLFWSSDGELNLRMARAVLERGADPNCENGRRIGESMLELARQVPERDHARFADVRFVDTKVVGLLLAQGSRLPSRSYCILENACEDGNIELVQLLLEHGVEPTPAEHYGTPLHSACAGGSLAVLDCLLAYYGDGVNLDTLCGSQTPLDKACASGHMSIIARLLDLGADTSIGNPLAHACSFGSIEIITRLLQWGVGDVHQRAHDIFTHAWRSKNPEEIVRVLMSHGIQLSADDSAGHEWCIERACLSDSSAALVKTLHDNMIANSIPINHDRLLYLACLGKVHSSEKVEIIKLLLAAGANWSAPHGPRGTPLEKAVHNHDIMQLFLSRGADPLALNRFSYPLLHSVCSQGDDQTVALFLELDVVDIHAKSISQHTPLHAYVGRSKGTINIDHLRKLIGDGSNINTISGHGGTPLHVALSKREPDALVIDTLISAGANIHAIDTSGRNMLHALAKASNVHHTKMLLEYGAGVGIRAVAGEEAVTPLYLACYHSGPELVELLLANGADPNAAANNGKTPLWVSCTYQCLRSTELLLANGADPHAPLPDGETLLHIASRGGNAVLIKMLLASGVDPAARCSRGSTPLHLCASQGDLDALRCLVVEGLVDVNDRDGSGRTALSWAMEPQTPDFFSLRREDHVQFLRSRGGHE